MIATGTMSAVLKRDSLRDKSLKRKMKKLVWIFGNDTIYLTFLFSLIILAAGLGGGGTKGGLTIDSVMGSQGSNHSGSRSGAGNHFPSSTSVTITATSSPSSSHSSSSVSTPSNSSHNSHHHHHHHQQNHNHHHSHHQQSSNKNKSGIKMKRDK